MTHRNHWDIPEGGSVWAEPQGRPGCKGHRYSQILIHFLEITTCLHKTWILIRYLDKHPDSLKSGRQSEREQSLGTIWVLLHSNMFSFSFCMSVFNSFVTGANTHKKVTFILWNTVFAINWQTRHGFCIVVTILKTRLMELACNINCYCQGKSVLNLMLNGLG